MRHLYAQRTEPDIEKIIELAMTFDRRRCGHHPNEYPEPLSTEACLRSVVDGKDLGTNKHCYIVASQSQDLRRAMRGIKGVPLIHVRRGVMVMEPMADDSVEIRRREEKSKFRAGLKGHGKRKRDDSDDEDENGEKDDSAPGEKTGDVDGKDEEPPKKKKKKTFGKKGPNPLSVKKKKKKPPAQDERPKKQIAPPTGTPAVKTGRKRRRKTAGSGSEPATTAPISAGGES